MMKVIEHLKEKREEIAGRIPLLEAEAKDKQLWFEKAVENLKGAKESLRELDAAIEKLEN